MKKDFQSIHTKAMNLRDECESWCEDNRVDMESDALYAQLWRLACDIVDSAETALNALE